MTRRALFFIPFLKPAASAPKTASTAYLDAFQQAIVNGYNLEGR